MSGGWLAEVADKAVAPNLQRAYAPALKRSLQLFHVPCLRLRATAASSSSVKPGACSSEATEAAITSSDRGTRSSAWRSAGDMAS